MRLFTTVLLTAVVFCISFVQSESRSLATTPAFSHRRLAPQILQRSRDIPQIRHVGSYNPRKSVICRAAVLEPVIASTSLIQRILAHGVTTFMSNWKAYTCIPFIAGFVGWFTNYLAVQMIFYPIRWRGLPIYKVEGEPLGLLGWQGIVPAKTLKMSEAMVNTTINELLTMEEIIQRLDPDKVADILLPQTGQIVQPFVDELLVDKPKQIKNFASTYSADSEGWIQKKVGHKFLRDLTVDVQTNIGVICNLRSCVVDMMMSDR